MPRPEDYPKEKKPNYSGVSNALKYVACWMFFNGPDIKADMCHGNVLRVLELDEDRANWIIRVWFSSIEKKGLVIKTDNDYGKRVITLEKTILRVAKRIGFALDVEVVRAQKRKEDKFRDTGTWV